MTISQTKVRKNTELNNAKRVKTAQNHPKKKRINIALQGGGSHGAYTWGVLKALLEDDRIDIEGISGTSAGAMNAVAVIQGLVQGDNSHAIDNLDQFWHLIGQKALHGLIQLNPYDKLMKNFKLSTNPFFIWMQYIGQFVSPYQSNPLNIHPMRAITEQIFNFDIIRNATNHKLFLCATHVASGKLKIFSGHELSHDALLASACVPQLFQAIEIDGNYYWDGGFIGNPAIYPLIYGCESPDILVIQIRRVHDAKLPITIHDINNRLGEITQNACLMREMRSIAFITKLIDTEVVHKDKLKKLNMHLIRDDGFFGNLERETGFCVDPDFLSYLHSEGYRNGKKWLAQHFDSIGVKTTAKIEEDYL